MGKYFSGKNPRKLSIICHQPEIWSCALKLQRKKNLKGNPLGVYMSDTLTGS